MKKEEKCKSFKNKHGLPLWLVIWWWASLLIGGPLCLRLLWEQTFMTWECGRQMVGFSLIHIYPGLFLLGLCGYALALTWPFLAIAYYFIKKKLPSKLAVIYFFALMIAIAVNFIPYDFWAHLGGVE